MNHKRGREEDPKENSTKIVWIDVCDGSANNLSLEVSFANEDRNRKSDLECIVEVLKRKRPTLCDALERGKFNFESESCHRPGKWISIGEHSPIKNNSDLRCNISNANNISKLHLSSYEHNNFDTVTRGKVVSFYYSCMFMISTFMKFTVLH